MIYIRDFEGLRIDNEQLNNAGFTTRHFHENLESLQILKHQYLIKCSIQQFKII